MPVGKHLIEVYDRALFIGGRVPELATQLK